MRFSWHGAFTADIHSDATDAAENGGMI